ncbi:MAG TPA: TonB-dependent receptor [Xanthomonadales bacterium]|nr:TonB-dependent receptor [Xanthomonadales bacterium]
MQRTAISLITASSLLLGSPYALAQEQEQNVNWQEEVLVTARKREETLQDVPFSISATTESQMQDRGMVSLEDVSQNVASFSVQNLGPGQSQVAIRGASAGQIVRDQPGVKEQVGVYLDESVISLSLFTPDIDLYDMNRVEVLRGPQGTLFGSGSLSGTVRYITNQPDETEQSYGLQFGTNYIDGGDVGYTVKGFFNTPMGDNAASRITFYYDDIAGYIDSYQPDGSINEDYNDGERYGGRVALKLNTKENLTVTPRLIFQNVEMNGWNRRDTFNILANPFTTTRPQVNIGENENFTQFDEPFTDDFFLADLNIAYEFDNGLLLTSITSYTDRSILVVRDAGALTSSITGGSQGFGPDVYTLNAPLDDYTDVDGWTQELRIGGGSDTLNWVVGLFYSSFERNYGQELLVPGYEDLTGIPTAGFIAPKDGLFWSALTYDFEQTAVFTEATWAMTDRLDITGGIRYYDFDESRVQSFDGIFAAPGTTVGSTTADGFAPRIIMDYALSDTMDLNAQISKGFRLGGINDPLNIPLCTPADLQTFGGNDNWDDEELWNYEIGLKSVIMDGRGTFNVAAFYQDIDDLQATVTAGSCSSRVVFNVPEAHSTGVELELSIQQTDNFDWALTASYISAELDSTVTSTDADGNTTVVGGIQDGNRLATVPELQGAFAATYTWPAFVDWEGYTTGLIQYVGDRYTQIGDQAEGFGVVDLNAYGANGIGAPFTQDFYTFDPLLDSYTTANLRLGFRNEAWDVSLYINNLTDEDAQLALDQERGTQARVGYLTNQPRTYGLTVRYDF